MPRKKKTEETQETGEESKEENKEEIKAEISEEETKEAKIGGAEEETKEVKEENLLVPLDEYKKSGISLGTKVITSFMEKYIFKRRPDGLATINTNEIDQKLRLAVNFLAEYKPEDIVMVCKREAGWKGLNLLGKLTGIRAFTKKYPAGVMTNPNLPDFFEPSLIFIVDPWIDKAALSDAVKLNLPVVSLCDTNNVTSNLDLIIPCNNKSGKSLGLIFWIIVRELIKKWGLDIQRPSLNDFTSE